MHPAIKRVQNVRTRRPAEGATVWTMIREVGGCQWFLNIVYTDAETMMSRRAVAQRIRSQRRVFRGQIWQQLAAIDTRRKGGVW